MKVGDEVIVNGEKKKIISIGYDESGVRVYNVEGSFTDYYETDLMSIDEVKDEGDHIPSIE